ncbi:nucleotidyltransferase substrate binding protein [Candidatus Palauibacter sp.]|uniref:nucleotidyltransferase substrate binding protein n=1 Tax=Candidatus Palauibacter sp. TaxID=3101350 RepID=UPI003C70270D
MTTYEHRPDFGPLERAIQRLEEGLERYRSDTTDLQIRDGLVQRFEFTYELGCKALRRYLEYTAPNPAVFDEMTFQDQIRTANEQGLLLGTWPDWRGYRRLRGMTSHTYSEAIAVEVVTHIPEFLEEMSYLRDQLQDRLA